MTRLFTDGAEFGDTLFFDTPSGFSANAVARSGNYSYYFGTGTGHGIKYIGADLSEFYYRDAFYQSTGMATSNYLLFYHGANAVIYFNFGGADFSMNAVVGGITVDTGTKIFNPDTWYLFEVYIKIANSGGRIVTKIDGIIDIDYTGDTLPSSDSHIDNIHWARISGSYGSYRDDLALNDTNGVNDNSWCGDGHVELLKADDNGDVNAWVGQDGDSVNNYLNVDDVPPDDDTTYNKGTVDATQDMYNVVDFTATGKIVTRIFSEGRAKDNAALSGTIKTGYKTSGTVYLSSAYTSLSSAYQRVVGDEAIINPADSDIWEDADLDAIQFVIECSISSSSSSSSTSSSSSSSSTTSSSSSTEIP